MSDADRKRILIQQIRNLPTLPTTLTKIINLVESNSSTAADLAEVISKDQSISSVILKLVNSAFYGHLRRISSISHAIVILGYQTVKTMALGVSIFNVSTIGKNSAFDRSRFWTHSIGVATIAKRLGLQLDKNRISDMESLFLSGLLHDLGKVVFDTYFHEEYKAIAEDALNGREWIGAVEIRHLGIGHAEAGYYLANKWQFPSSVMSAIQFHHEVEKSPENEAVSVAVIHIADHLCRKMKLGSGGDNEEVTLDAKALEICGMDNAALARIMLEIEKDRDTIESFTLE